MSLPHQGASALGAARKSNALKRTKKSSLEHSMCFDTEYTKVHWTEASEFLTNIASPRVKSVLVPKFSKDVWPL